jgi:hypothetical protein
MTMMMKLLFTNESPCAWKTKRTTSDGGVTIRMKRGLLFHTRAPEEIEKITEFS